MTQSKYLNYLILCIFVDLFTYYPGSGDSIYIMDRDRAIEEYIWIQRGVAAEF